jgi:hypothetical protein
MLDLHCDFSVVDGILVVVGEYVVGTSGPALQILLETAIEND